MFSAKVREKSIGMTRPMHVLLVFLVTVMTLLVTAPKLWAIPLADARIIIEINATDGDAGIQIFLDGEGWNLCQVSDPNGIIVLNIQASGSVGMQGITELFFESAEPSFDEQSLEDLLALFPKGKYEIECMTTEGQMLKGSATLTHKLPAAPVVTPEEGAEVDPNMPVAIQWQSVTTAFPGGELGVIAGYEITVERLKDGLKFSITLPATATSVTVPPEFIQPKTQYKFEVLAIEASGNQTISESAFTTTAP
jgi:hypothetical protein